MKTRTRLLSTPFYGIVWPVLIAQMSVSQGDRLADLVRPETTEQAADALLEQAKAQPRFRSQLGETLPKLLTTSTDEHVIVSEARLAGKLRMLPAIPVLIQLLNQPQIRFTMMGTMTSMYELEDDPVGRALADMGAPAVPALAAPLESANVATRERAARILVLINTSRSFALLRYHIDRETDKSLKGYIAANLEVHKKLKLGFRG